VSAQAFEPRGLLALEPRAFGMLLMPDFQPPANEERGPVTVVSVRGPLMHHADPCSDSYDAIKARVDAALQSSARAVLLRIDSPGGLVSGCFDTVRELRRMAEAARKPLYAYVENACSAAYALACACEKIFSAASGTVGSVGVIDTVLDVTELDARQGVKLAIITSGAHKADSNPHTPLTDSKLAAAQASVTAVAGLFFALVAEARGVDAGAVQALEAATFPGVLATGPRLVDAIATFEETLAMVANGSAANAAEAEVMDYEKAVAALRKVAEGEDANAKAAKRALAALDGGEEKKDEAKAEGDEGEKKPEEKPEAKAEGDEEKKPEAKVAAASAQAVDLKTLKAEIKLEMRAEAQEAADRQALLATRPDLSANMRAQLSALPLATVKAMIGELPKVATPAQAAIAGATAEVNPTKGANQVAGSKPEVSAVSPYAAQLDRQMGLTTEGLGTRVEGSQLILSATGAKAGK
jgi:ClpP class serine protease